MRSIKSKSNVFKGFDFDMPIDRDFQHQKGWAEKIQQTKQIQQMKQIDKMFQSIVKQRMYGSIINGKSHIYNQYFSDFNNLSRNAPDQFNKTSRISRISNLNSTAMGFSPIKRLSQYSIQNSRMSIKQSKKKQLQPLKSGIYENSSNKKEKKSQQLSRQNLYGSSKRSQTIEMNRTKHQIFEKMNQSEKSQNKNLISLSNQKLLRSRTDKASTIISNKLRKLSKLQSIVNPKDIVLHQNSLFQEYFKNLSNTPNIFIYDIKINKDTIINKVTQDINPKILDYFFYFFGFTNIITYRQYKKGLEKAFNSSIDLIYFFTFRILDQSGNGFLTISDLFRFLQKYQNSQYLQSEIFLLKGRINQKSKQLIELSSQQRQIKPSLSQILVTNHKLKHDQISQLLKQSTQQQITKGGQVKLTCYSQSVMSLEHDVQIRLKQYQLQTQKNQSQALNANKNIHQFKQQSMVQDGLRLQDFANIFKGKRPKIFCQLIGLLTGLNNQDYQ